MGLTTWKYAPDGRILKSDVVIAKNYLHKDEIRKLERAISGYFDYIEDLIERENVFTMREFAASVNEFLAFRRYQILPDNDKGKVSHAEAEAKAIEEYELSRSAGFRPLSPLGTAQATFTAYGSRNSKFNLF